MTLSITHRTRPGPGRVEIHRQEVGPLQHVHLIAYSPRPVELSLGLTEAQAVELSFAVLSTLPASFLVEISAKLAAFVGEQEASAEGALGNNTDTDSHPRARHERGGDCRLSASDVVAGRIEDLDQHTLALIAGGPIGIVREPVE